MIGGRTGWAFKDVLPAFKAQEDWEGGANGPVYVRTPGDPHPTAGKTSRAHTH